MKKTLLIALAGLMLLAFTQCGNGGSKEFNDNKALMDKMEKAIKNAGSCDEMQDALVDVFKEVIDKEYNYTDDEKITSDEEAKLEELSKKLDELYIQKAKELGCEDEDSGDDSSWDDLNDSLDDLGESLDDLGESIENAADEINNALGGLFE